MTALHPRNFDERVRAEPPQDVKRLRSGVSGAYLATWRDGLKAVVKKSRARLPDGRPDQRGISAWTHPRREVAFFRLAQALGWDAFVPQTCMFSLFGTEASAQAYVPAALHFADLAPEMARLKTSGEAWGNLFRSVASGVSKDEWRRLVFLDLVAGSRDRHANNVGFRVVLDGDVARRSLVAWDNAASFGRTFSLYRNVPHKRIFADALDVDPEWDTLSAFTRPQLEAAVATYLSRGEVEDAWRRLQFVLEFPYRLPWDVLSKGRPSRDFPSYDSYFTRTKNANVAQVPVFC